MPVWVSHQHGTLRLVFALQPTFIEKKVEMTALTHRFIANR